MGYAPQSHRHGVARARPTGSVDFNDVQDRASADPLRVLRRYAPDAADKLNNHNRGPCPVHGGTGPNFSVGPWGWHCHSVCAGGGDAVDLGARLTGWSRVEVLRDLAVEFGVGRGATVRPQLHRLPPRRPVAPDPLATLRDDGVLPQPKQSVYWAVLGELDLGPMGRDFCARRGLDPERCFRWGWRSVESLSGWRALDHALALSFLPLERQHAHVDQLPTYYAPAVVIPHTAPDGVNVDALRLRALSDDLQPKYRSLSGAVSTLYNRHRVVNVAGQVLHVAEGELDAATLEHHGCRAVGVPGASSWRPDWFAGLSLAACVVLWFDGDAAGRAAQDKLCETLRDYYGLDWVADRVRVVVLPDGRDVNDLHRAGHLAAIVGGAPWMS